MQVLKHETVTNENELAEKIKQLIADGHCIENVARRAIDATTYTLSDKRFVNVYTIESLTVADLLGSA